MKKTKIILIIVMSLFSCTTKPLVEKKWFPDNIENYGPIDEYIKNFSADNIDTARNEYLYLLEFITEVINASHENIERARRLDSLTAKRPAMKDGKLTIIEDTEMTIPIKIWDNERNDYVEAASFSVLYESLLIYAYGNLYNKLLDHWISLTGELLGQHIDVNAEDEKLMQDIKPLLEPKYYQVF